MIIYGTGEKKRKLNQPRKPQCPNCGKSSIDVYLFHKYAHIFWIPCFPYGKRLVAVCEECQTGYEDGSIPQELQNRISDIKNSAKTPPYLFAGLFIIIIGISLLTYNSVGPKTYKYPTGEKQAKGKMIDDEMNGEWTFWHKNGQIATIQFYKKGIEDSIWKWWNEDGTLSKTGEYKDGLLHGKWVFYYPSGQMEAEENYDNNRLQGQATYWHENGQISARGEFDRDYKTGHWVYWYESGTISEESDYESGNMTGDWFSYYEDGSKCAHTVSADSVTLIIGYWDEQGNQLVKNGNGEYITYHENGEKESQGKVINGKPFGKWSFWYPNKSIKEKGRYSGDIYYIIHSWDSTGNQEIINGNGDYVSRYENGMTASEGKYLNGRMEGEWKFRNENGNLIQIMQYVSGKVNGNISYFYDSGEKQVEGEFINDIRTGTWKWYFEDGTIQSQVNFEKGEKEGEQLFWSETGKIIKKEYYEKGKLINEEVIPV